MYLGSPRSGESCAHGVGRVFGRRRRRGRCGRRRRRRGRCGRRGRRQRRCGRRRIPWRIRWRPRAAGRHQVAEGFGVTFPGAAHVRALHWFGAGEAICEPVKLAALKGAAGVAGLRHDRAVGGHVVLQRCRLSDRRKNSGAARSVAQKGNCGRRKARRREARGRTALSPMSGALASTCSAGRK